MATRNKGEKDVEKFVEECEKTEKEWEENKV